MIKLYESFRAGGFLWFDLRRERTSMIGMDCDHLDEWRLP